MAGLSPEETEVVSNFCLRSRHLAGAGLGARGRLNGIQREQFFILWNIVDLVLRMSRHIVHLNWEEQRQVMDEMALFLRAMANLMGVEELVRDGFM